jgi:hypothetical protein
MGAQVVTVNDVLDGHAALDIQCLDQIYFKAYIPKLPTSAQVVAFYPGQLGAASVRLECVRRPFNWTR